MQKSALQCQVAPRDDGGVVFHYAFLTPTTKFNNKATNVMDIIDQIIAQLKLVTL